jgi:hypothetical protein
MTEQEFEARFGQPPQLDDLTRVECADAGKMGHWLCGVCTKHDKPRFLCGCIYMKEGDDGDVGDQTGGV